MILGERGPQIHERPYRRQQRTQDMEKASDQEVELAEDASSHQALEEAGRVLPGPSEGVRPMDTRVWGSRPPELGPNTFLWC